MKRQTVLTTEAKEENTYGSRPSAAWQVFAPAKPALPPSMVVGCGCRAYMDVFTMNGIINNHTNRNGRHLRNRKANLALQITPQAKGKKSGETIRIMDTHKIN